MKLKESEKRKKLYAIGCFIAVILLIGTFGAIDHDVISLGQGIWQTVWSLALGLWCFNGIRLEETRAARRPRRW